MITDPSGTTTFPEQHEYTLDAAYAAAQESLWSPMFGLLIAWALFACLCVQIFFYIRNFPTDNRVIRFSVFALFVIEIAGTAYSTWTTYVIIVRSWGHSPFYKPQMWGSMLFDCSVASIVHALYAWRIHILMTRRWLACVCVAMIAVLSMAQFSCCVAAALLNAFQTRYPPAKVYVARRLFHTWIACASIADVIIAVIITIKLYTSRTGLAATDKVIKNVLYITVPGGASTALATLLILVIQLTSVGTFQYQFLLTSLTKIYSNSVLLCLNLRILHRYSDNGSGLHGMQSFVTSSQGGGHSGSCAINVQREVEKSSTIGFDIVRSDEQASDSEQLRKTGQMSSTHVRSLWHQSSLTTQSSQDESFMTFGKPTLSTAHAPLTPAQCHIEPPFSEPMTSRRYTSHGAPSKTDHVYPQ